MISYHPFWETIKAKNISTYTLINQYNIAPSTIQRLRKYEYVSVRTIDELCQILNCKIEDVVEVLPDDMNEPMILKLNDRQKKMPRPEK